jgi:hypothetical protein
MHAPTQRQIDFAHKLAIKLNVPLPAEILNDLKKCARWIDEHYEHRPPSKELVKEAMQVATEHNCTIPDEVLQSSQKLKFWIKNKLNNRHQKELNERQMVTLEAHAPANVLKEVKKGNYKVGRQFLTEYYAKMAADRIVSQPAVEAVRDIPVPIKDIPLQGAPELKSTNINRDYPGYITVAQAAKRLNITPSSVTNLAKSGRIKHMVRDTASNSILIDEACELLDMKTIEEASKLVHVTTRKVWNLVQTGKIQCVTRNDKVVLISLHGLKKTLHID